MHVKPEVRTELHPSQKTLIESLDKLHVDHTHVPINDTVEKKKSSWWSNLLYSGRNEKPRASSKEPSLPESKKQKQLETSHSSSNLQAISETKKDDAFHGLKKKKSAATTKKLSSYGKNYEPYKAESKPSTKIVDAVVNKAASKISKEDQDRNNRHSMVVNLLNGTTKLSDYFTSKYKIGEVLGDGAFGFVLTAIQIEDNFPVAIKFIIKSRVPKDLWNKETNLPAEIHILSKLRHPNIIRYIEHIDERDFILLVTELFGTEWDSSNPKLSPEKNLGLRNAKKKSNVALSEKSDCSPLFRLTEEQEKSIRRKTSFDLFECIDAHKQLPEPVVKKIMGQIALAINYMHQKNIVHRDIKDENVVIDENYNVKLVDFGSASIIPTRKEKYFTKFNGTTHFASPEVSKGMSYRGPEAEAWSLGVLFFTIICGENPFQNRNEIIKGEFTYPFKIKDDCKNLIDQLLEVNEKNRATIEDVLNHPYLKSEVALLIKKYRG